MADINAYEGPAEAGFGDYVALLKPRVMSLVVFTAFVGAVTAQASLHGALSPLRSVYVRDPDGNLIELSEPQAVVIAGAGRGFCSGADLDPDTILARRGKVGRQMTAGINPIVRLLREIPVPVVAAVNGPAAGVGFSLALAADLLVAGRCASFALTFARIGASPDGGAIHMLARRIGEARTAQVAMLGQAIGGAEAHALGLACELAEEGGAVPAAMALARRLAQGPTVSYAMIKRQILAAGGASLDDALRLETLCQDTAFNSADFEEGVRAFTERRKPVFAGR